MTTHGCALILQDCLRSQNEERIQRIHWSKQIEVFKKHSRVIPKFCNSILFCCQFWQLFLELISNIIDCTCRATKYKSLVLFWLFNITFFLFKFSKSQLQTSRWRHCGEEIVILTQLKWLLFIIFRNSNL